MEKRLSHTKWSMISHVYADDKADILKVGKWRNTRLGMSGLLIVICCPVLLTLQNSFHITFKKWVVISSSEARVAPHMSSTFSPVAICFGSIIQACKMIKINNVLIY